MADAATPASAALSQAQATFEAIWQVMVAEYGRHPGPWAKLPERMQRAYVAGAEAAAAPLAAENASLRAECLRLESARAGTAADCDRFGHHLLRMLRETPFELMSDADKAVLAELEAMYRQEPGSVRVTLPAVARHPVRQPGT